MREPPQGNADDQSPSFSVPPVPKTFCPCSYRLGFLITLMVFALCGARQTLSGEQADREGGFVSEQINLFGVPTDLMIQQKIYETVRTWSQVREITLKYLGAQPQDKPSLREAGKRLETIQINLAQKFDKSVEALAAKRGESLWNTAAIFQGAEGSAIDPKTQDASDILNGLYQIQTALKLKIENE
jgi:hypothetical protein